MAAITSIDATQPGAFTAAITTLTAADTITFSPSKKQLLVLRNGTGASLTLVIDGASGTTVTASGVGVIDVSGGYSITVAASASKAVVLGTISAYCQGVVNLTGASGMSAQLFDL